ncbi:MAG: malonate decarboxylase alpha subunit [Rhodospirillaceae bacterium]|jgi:malonate decarboxylase alpha subunit|nr:malonate decarboxylase alpha subunit [Rhodospirillaceae bacterium]MEA2852434.1 malonate decarboxylase alpha subunit [Rhodospirillaceae bacterium]
MTDWRKGQGARDARVRAGAKFAKGKIVEARDATALLESVIRPGDRICLEGDNQKQADLLAGALGSSDQA